MIISHAHKFVFMHNPKVGGTSVRRTLEPFHDVGLRFHKNDPDPDSPTHQVDRAHIGIDEFARYFPDIWEQAQDYTIYALWRPVRARLFSSVGEYSRRFADTDIRFLKPQGRRDFLMQTLDLLEAKGTADGILSDYEFTHFRPQHIFLQSAEHQNLDLEVIALADIDQLFARIGAQAGQPDLSPQARQNFSENISLPPLLARFAANRQRRRALTSLPGLAQATAVARRVLLRRQPQKPSGETFDLSEQDDKQLAAFIDRFYARDLALVDALSPVSQTSRTTG